MQFRPVYTNTARFDHSARAMTEDEMFAAAPSIFAESAHHSRTERFKPIPTIEVLRGLMKEGFMPVGARQCIVRRDDRRNFTKHEIRLRKLEDKNYQVGDTVFEMRLLNGNDGSSSYDLLAGLFRIACLNSLVSLTQTMESVKVRHTGDVQKKVIEGTYKVLQTADLALAAPQDWSKMVLNNDERRALAESAKVIRFGNAEGVVELPVQAGQLLAPRRVDDAKNDLWSTFNVIQENCVRGGMSGTRINEEGVRRRFTTREVKGIDADVKLNRALWTLANEMAKIKKAA